MSSGRKSYIYDFLVDCFYLQQQFILFLKVDDWKCSCHIFSTLAKCRQHFLHISNGNTASEAHHILFTMILKYRWKHGCGTPSVLVFSEANRTLKNIRCSLKFSSRRADLKKSGCFQPGGGWVQLHHHCFLKYEGKRKLKSSTFLFFHSLFSASCGSSWKQLCKREIW